MSWPRSSPGGYRRGERPALQEYVDRCPDMADEIRELFPALVEVEQVEGVAGDDALQPAAVAAPRRCSRSATTGSSARSAAAAWASSTRPSRSRWAAGWR